MVKVGKCVNCGIRAELNEKGYCSKCVKTCQDESDVCEFC